MNIVKKKLWGLLQIGYGIRDYYWRDYWGNIKGNYWIIALGKIIESEKLKYMKENGEKPSIYSYTGIEDY